MMDVFCLSLFVPGPGLLRASASANLIAVGPTDQY